MSQSNLERLSDEEIPSILRKQIQLNKVLLKVKKHAETCACCKEVLEKE